MTTPDTIVLEKDRKELFESSSVRSRRLFQISVGVFVVVISFFYGLSSGWNKQFQSAYANYAMGGAFRAGGMDTVELPARVDLPYGVHATSLGNDVRINAKRVDGVTFVTERDVESVLRAQVAKWELDGLIAMGTGKKRRGVAVAINEATGERHSLTIWRVQPHMRRATSQGYPYQGMYSVTDAMSAVDARPEEQQGQVPNVPLPFDGKGGAVFSSQDPGGRTFSSVYTNPGSVNENVIYYRNEMQSRHWREDSDGFNEKMGGKVATLNFAKGKEELILFFNPLKSASEFEPKTVVTVVRRPKTYFELRR